MICPKCKSEFVEGILSCPDCGVQLVYQLREETESISQPMENYNYTLIYHPINSQEVALIKMILEREDIPYYIRNEPLHKAVIYSIRGPGNLELYVATPYADDTIALLKKELGHD